MDNNGKQWTPVEGVSWANGGHPATYYDGRSAKARPVRIMADSPRSLRISAAEDDTQAIVWTLEEVIPSGSLRDFPLQLRRKNDTGERLVIEDPGARHFVEAWLGPELQQQRSRKIRNWLLAGGAAWALITLIWLNMDAVLNVAVSFIPESWEHKMGRESKEQIARILTLTPVGEVPWCREVQGMGALERLTARMDMPMSQTPEDNTRQETSPSAGEGKSPDAEAAPPASPGEDTRPVEISVLKSKMVNAFALPGRHIVVTSAMIEEAETPDELAGVLAHEMGHVTERHSTKRVLRAYGFGLIFQLIAGQGELFNSMGGLGNALVQSKFSRADEALADRLAVERLNRAGMDAAALADLFERIQEQERNKMGEAMNSPMWEYLSDHPSFDERIAEIRSLTKAGEQKESGAVQPALSAEDWAALKNICAEE